MGDAMRMRRLFLGALATLVMGVGLTSCASMDNRMSPARLIGQDPTKGYVVISGGASERCIQAATALYFSLQTAGYNKNVLVLANVDAAVVKSDYADHQGSLSVFGLAPGQYQFYPVTLNPYHEAVRVPRFTFTVAAGETVYLGEFFMAASCSFSNVFGMIDQRQRDIALLREMNPIFQTTTVTTRLATPAGFIVDRAY